MTTHDKPITASKRFALSRYMQAYCILVLRQRGRDFDRCEQCAGSTNGRPDLHHQRYEGATIEDIQIVCRSCNRLAVNCGLT